ncbi:hypothetical protein COEREDRAFT_79317 [Coemansia reversa NRRL 1564]|uniref:Cyclin N-terminal domain-containing protein n=1 Tax=Coemansia reversa (strain ATCC 12441 / NRRL 1564) TaxID=763665 RepID=A0A2G5BK62_COERN|nr:hypothetical protein COEREDRAFT_79317 [Coemansia reversa NRRL 1564]|eukprot:PIA19395.1 hypothetical protein COEREDRAFT_79317 [Coemansia reversa NRRL 1564]
MDALNSEQLAFVATRAFSKLWMPRHAREGLQPFQKFCSELLRSTQIAVPIVMLALLYVQRFKQRFPGLYGGSGSEYRMFVVALMLSSKILEDNTFTVQTWSEVSHLPVKELIIMQREFLLALDHRLHVTDTEYNAWIGKLQTIVLANTSMANAVAPSTPQMLSAFSSVDMCVPNDADLQMVPSPTVPFAREPLMDGIIPSPPAKRVRYSAKPCQQTCPAPELISMPVYSGALPQIYTPPSVSAGFTGGEFTFKVPASSTFAPHSTGMITYPQSTQAFGTVPNYLTSLMAFTSSALPTVNPMSAAYGTTNQVCEPSVSAAAVHQQQQQHFAMQPLVSGPGFTGIMNINSSQQQQPLFSTAAAASALASQYPALYYGVPTLCPNVGGAMPIYNYGA